MQSSLSPSVVLLIFLTLLGSKLILTGIFPPDLRCVKAFPSLLNLLVYSFSRPFSLVLLQRYLSKCSLPRLSSISTFTRGLSVHVDLKVSSNVSVKPSSAPPVPTSAL